jgi:hypothetical protein
MPFHIGPSAALAMVIFAVVSAIIGSALAGAGGWRELAARYPAPAVPPPDEVRYRFSSLRTAGGFIGVATYESCVNVGVSARGISLALWAPLRLFHPGLLVPWDAIESCRSSEVYGRRSTRFTVREAGSVTVYGRAASAIAEWASRAGITAATT